MPRRTASSSGWRDRRLPQRLARLAGPRPASLPHVPGHELAGTVAAVGGEVREWAVGDRVTHPFVSACGTCDECAAGNQQVCAHQTQPGLHALGLVRRVRRARRGRRQPRRRPRGARPDDGRRAGLPVRDGVPGRHRVGRGALRRVGRGARLRRRRALGDHDRRRAGPGWSPPTSPGRCRLPASSAPRSSSTGAGRSPAESQNAHGRRAHVSVDAVGRPRPARTRCGACGRAAGTCRSGCSPGAGRAPRADGRGDRPRARDPRQPRHGSARLPAAARPGLAGRLDPAPLITRGLALEEAGEALAGVGREPGIAVVTRFTVTLDRRPAAARAGSRELSPGAPH